MHPRGDEFRLELGGTANQFASFGATPKGLTDLDGG